MRRLTVAHEAAERVPLHRFLTWRLHRVAKLTDRFSGAAYAQEFGLAVGEARCLAAIGSCEPLSLLAVAAQANLDKGQASRAAQALVERGLVAKAASQDDGRGVVLTLTAPGRKLWRALMKVIARRNAEIFGCLSNAEQKRLATALDRVIAHADREAA